MLILKLIRRRILKNKIQKRNKLKREIQNKHGIFFINNDHFEVLYSINNQSVNEYNYLLNYILSKQNILNENIAIDEHYFRKIAKNYSIIRNLIQEELAKETLQEQLAYGITRETAVSNMKNLQTILYSITKFQNEFNQRK